MSAARPEALVRRCARCARPAAVLVEGFAFGVQTPWLHGQPPPERPIARGTFRCQSCGAAMRWHRLGPLRVLGLLVVASGALFMGLGALLFTAQAIRGVEYGDPLGSLACVGITFVGLALALVRLVRPHLAVRRWPIAHAPRPAVTLGPPAHHSRLCLCGGAAPVARVVPIRLKGILPIGAVYEHACPECKATFNVHDVRGVVFSGFAATFLSAAGALISAVPPGSAMGAADQNRWIGMGLLAIGVLAFGVPIARVVGRLRHPLARPSRF